MLSTLARRGAIAILCAVAVAACGDEPTVIGPVGIGPDGGTIDLGSGTVTLVFPPGAVSEDVTITATSLTGPQSSLVVPGTVWDIVMSPAVTLAQPVAVTIRVGAATLPTGVAASELRLFKVVSGASGDRWQQVPGSTYDAANGSVTASLTSFSVYGILGVPAATLVIGPATTTLTVGGTQQLTATIADSAGTLMPGRAIAWTSSNPAVATVSATGLVSAVAAGTASIEGATESASDTIQFTIQGGGGGGGGTTPWVEELFNYASTLDMMNDPRNIYSQNEDFNGQRIALDTAGFDAASNSMRFDYPDRGPTGGTGTSGRCTDYTIGRNLTLPTPVQEVWAEFYIKFSSNFATIAPSAWGCTSNPDLKFIFGRLNGVSDRFIVKVGTGHAQEWHAGYPGGAQAEDTYVLPTSQYPMSAYWNNTWFRIRVHFKLSTTATSGDGAMHVWLDNQLVVDGNNLSVQRGGVRPSDIYGLALGRNMNQGPGQAQSVWWGRVRVYNTNPGW